MWRGLAIGAAAITVLLIGCLTLFWALSPGKFGNPSQPTVAQAGDAVSTDDERAFGEYAFVLFKDACPGIVHRAHRIRQVHVAVSPAWLVAEMKRADAPLYPSEEYGWWGFATITLTSVKGNSAAFYVGSGAKPGLVSNAPREWREFCNMPPSENASFKSRPDFAALDEYKKKLRKRRAM